MSNNLLRQVHPEPNDASQAKELNNRLLVSATRLANEKALPADILKNIHQSAEEMINYRFDPDYVGATMWQLSSEKMHGDPVLLTRTEHGYVVEKISSPSLKIHKPDDHNNQTMDPDAALGLVV